MNAMRLYRISNHLYRLNIPILPKLIYRLIYLLFNCIIPCECEIGKGTKLAYGGIGVVIHKNAVIGNGVVIESNVTIGGRNNNEKVPRIGNNVFIGTGARILGDVQIGEGSIIGANAVVVKNVPCRCSVGGVPARVLHTDIDINEKCNIRDIVKQ